MRRGPASPAAPRVGRLGGRPARRVAAVSGGRVLPRPDRSQAGYDTPRCLSSCRHKEQFVQTRQSISDQLAASGEKVHPASCLARSSRGAGPSYCSGACACIGGSPRDGAAFVCSCCAGPSVLGANFVGVGSVPGHCGCTCDCAGGCALDRCGHQLRFGQCALPGRRGRRYCPHRPQRRGRRRRRHLGRLVDIGTSGRVASVVGGVSDGQMADATCQD